jgi:cytochrome c peroxidase
MNMKIIGPLLLLFSTTVMAQDRFLESEMSALPPIKDSFDKNIKPIFEKKCFDCHSSRERVLPWYAVIPGIKQLIASDIQDAQEEVDMTDGFPFNGTGSVRKDLRRLLKEVENEDMPPLLYKWSHNAQLTPEELAAVREWVNSGVEAIDKLGPTHK